MFEYYTLPCSVFSHEKHGKKAKSILHEEYLPIPAEYSPFPYVFAEYIFLSESDS